MIKFLHIGGIFMKLVLVRHGESEWNLQNRFTGWVDVDLTEKGVNEAKAAGKSLRELGYVFDIAFSEKSNQDFELHT